MYDCLLEYEYLTASGYNLDSHHHEHSRYDYDEDGIAINKGDWLVNRYTGRGDRVSVYEEEKLKKLLFKQAALECYGGYADNEKVLRYYLYEYYYSSIDYIDNGFAEKYIDWMSREIFLGNPKAKIYSSSVKQSMLEKGGKVHVIDGDLKKYNKGERMFNFYWMEQMIKEHPGHSYRWYADFSKKWAKNINGRGWSRDSFIRFFKSKYE